MRSVDLSSLLNLVVTFGLAVVFLCFMADWLGYTPYPGFSLMGNSLHAFGLIP